MDGPSFQLRNNRNVDCLKNSIIENGTPRFKKKLKGKILSLLTGGGGNTNYWHWLFDVLPRLKIYKDTNSNLDELDYFLFPNLNKNFQNESLDLIDINKGKRYQVKIIDTYQLIALLLHHILILYLTIQMLILLIYLFGFPIFLEIVF